MRRTLVAVLLAALSCKETAHGDAFDRAAEAAGRAELKKAAELYAEAAKSEPDPARRAKAETRLANIEWRVFQQHDAARARLLRVAQGEREAFAARIELARVALDRKNGAVARSEARSAMQQATTRRERQRAAMALARVVLETEHTPDEIAATVASLRAVIAEAGPSTDATHMLLRAAIVAGDGATAMEAIDGYYHVSKFHAPPNAIAAAHATLVRLLPSWRGSDAERAAISEALGGVRFFAEAALVARAPSDVVAYAESIERIETAVDEYYRQMALGEEDHDDLEDAIDREFRALWPRFSKETYDRKRAEEVLTKRFGTYVILGKTGGFQDCHFAHVVADRTLTVEQYGRKGTLRFVELDAIVSNGFGTFLTDGAGGDGGWATDKEIYQVRPAYADAPLRAWRLMTDEEVRAEHAKETAEETARDRGRAKSRPIGPFPGLAKRLKTQYLAGVYAAHPARDAFLARVEKDTFQSSIELHEGRHAIDKLSKERFKTWELEYRAKLSEIALADAPRAALQSVVDNTIGGDSPHGRANEHLMKGIVAWMETHRREIAGLDESLPPMPQLDRLSDDQIRTAVRSLDPLASLQEKRRQRNAAVPAADRARGSGEMSRAQRAKTPAVPQFARPQRNAAVPAADQAASRRRPPEYLCTVPDRLCRGGAHNSIRWRGYERASGAGKERLRTDLRRRRHRSDDALIER